MTEYRIYLYIYIRNEMVVEENDKKSTKTLILNIPAELHHEIKAEAAWRNITIRRYVLQALLQKMKRDKEFK